MATKKKTVTRKKRAGRKRAKPKVALLDKAAWKQPKQTAATRIAKQLNEQLAVSLTSGEVQPGDFLGTEAEIAEAFNTSRIPVRDALQTLQGMGMLDIRVGNAGGVFVAQPNPERFEEALAIQLQLIGITDSELYAVWPTLEGLAAGMAATHATAEDVDQLSDILSLQQKAISDSRKFVEFGMGFRLKVAECSRNRMLIAMLTVLWQSSYEKFWSIQLEKQASKILRNSQQLVGSIKNGNPEKAREIAVRLVEAAIKARVARAA